MPEPGRRVALGVEVDHQDPVAELGQRGAEVHRGGGLAHPALLVGDRDHPGQLVGLGAGVVVARPTRRRPRPPSGTARTIRAAGRPRLEVEPGRGGGRPAGGGRLDVSALGREQRVRLVGPRPATASEPGSSARPVPARARPDSGVASVLGGRRRPSIGGRPRCRLGSAAVRRDRSSRHRARHRSRPSPERTTSVVDISASSSVGSTASVLPGLSPGCPSTARRLRDLGLGGDRRGREPRGLPPAGEDALKSRRPRPFRSLPSVDIVAILSGAGAGLPSSAKPHRVVKAFRNAIRCST